jgi:hypothetical protein
MMQKVSGHPHEGKEKKMAIIEITRDGKTWGKGEGEVNSKAQTARINSWINQGAMTVDMTYGLKSGGKSYTGKCRTNVLPIDFVDVE